jgi:hypothetical protein
MFNKVIENQYGDNAGYWKCVGIIIDPIRKKSIVQISLYKNKQAFNAGKTAQETKTVILNASNFPFGEQQLASLLSFIQQRVKQNDVFFSDASFEE